MNNQLSLEKFIAVAILMDGSHHHLTEKAYEQICGAQKDEFIQPYPYNPMRKMTMFRVSSISEIMDMEQYQEQYPQRTSNSYGQNYSQTKLDGSVSKLTLAQSMEKYIKTHPENSAVKKFYDQFTAWKRTKVK